ncbi:MAG: aldehyde dehydrogenase family protein [Cyclobacteriaceae bacterium]
MEVENHKKVNQQTVKQAFATLKNRHSLNRHTSLASRKVKLKKLLNWVMDNRTRLKEAVHKDFQKPPVEVDISEAYPVIGEIKHALSNLDQWARPTKVDATINYLGTRSEVRYEPKGVCLILSPWNFPFNLSVGPLVSCIAAGNVALLKPSEETPNTSQLIADMVEEVFDGDVIVLQGDKEVASELLALPFDHIFFTGSPTVGKIVMRAAADHLTSVTLELGGKSPAIIHSSSRIKEAAKRIVFGKFLNNGQTCIAPDYLIVHEDVKEEIIKALKTQVIKLFGDGAGISELSSSYGRVINERHFDRLKEMVSDAVEKGGKVELEGKLDPLTRFFHPTIISDAPLHARIMEEEIFGPILPIVTFRNVEEVVELVNSKPKPLALYVFSANREFRETVLSQTSAGSVCINDCVLQFTHPNLPFGGVNNSGIGKSHGYYGFLSFSNEKPVLKQKRGLALSYLFYPPFSQRMKMLLEPILRWF